MKYKLLKLLICPYCKRNFKLNCFEKIKKKDINNKDFIEISKGILECQCSIYPIVGSIPRILETAYIDNLKFFKKYKSRIPKSKIKKYVDNKFKKNYFQTKKSFEFQWLKFGSSNIIYGKTKQEEIGDFFSKYCHSTITKNSLRKKLTLDAGCGHGRYSESLAELGVEIIAIDLGRGINVAWKRLNKFSNAHAVQCNILELPFKKNIFDYVYSVGVIHHTPNTKQAFINLANPVKKKGAYSIWVYPRETLFFENLNKLARFFTTKLPPGFLYLLCYPLVPLLFFKKPYGGVRFGKSSWKECVQTVYDWLSPKYQSHHTYSELKSWFKESGFRNVERLKASGLCAAGIKK